MTTAKSLAVAAALAALCLTSGAGAQSLAPPMASTGARPGVARLEVVRRGAAERDCPDAAALASLVDTVANRPATARGPGEGDVALAVVVEPAGRGFRATLQAGGARTGERVLEDATDPTCRALAEAIAVTVVLLLDARAGMPSVGPADPGAATEFAPRIPVPVPAAPPVAPAPSIPSPSAPPPAPVASSTDELVDPRGASEGDAAIALGAPTVWSIDAAVLGGATVTGGGVDVGAWARRRLGPTSIGVGARVVTPSEHVFANGAVELWSARGTVEGCLELRVGARIAAAPCATAAVGAMIAHGQGFDRVDAGVLPTVSLGGAALAALGITDATAALVRLGIAGSPVRPAFQVEDDGNAASGEFGEAYRAPAVVADAGAGLRLSFD